MGGGCLVRSAGSAVGIEVFNQRKSRAPMRVLWACTGCATVVLVTGIWRVENV